MILESVAEKHDLLSHFSQVKSVLVMVFVLFCLISVFYQKICIHMLCIMEANATDLNEIQNWYFDVSGAVSVFIIYLSQLMDSWTKSNSRT